MNEAESRKFIDEFSMAFPAILDAARNSPNIEGTKRIWAASWDDLTIDECRAALRELIKGDPLTYEQIRSPGQTIRKLVVTKRSQSLKSEAEIAQDRLHLTDKKRRQREYASGGYSMSKAFEALKVGELVDDALKLV